MSSPTFQPATLRPIPAMAETVATAAGIAGILGVLQSLLQCYKDFLVARDFADDFAICQMRAILLEKSTKTWALAVWLQHDSGEPRSECLIKEPTEENIFAVKTTLEMIRKLLQSVLQEIQAYTVEQHAQGAAAKPKASASGDSQGANSNNKKPATMARIAKKMHRTIHREHDVEHPGTMKRTTWALVDKGRLEGGLDDITKLVNQLHISFPPVDPKPQLDQYCETVKKLELNPEELKEISAASGDYLFKTIAKMLENERVTGIRFKGMKMSDDVTLNVGDYYATDWTGRAERQAAPRDDTFEELSVTGRALVNVGDQFGGKSLMQMRLEQMEAARRDNKGGSGAK